MLHSLTVAAVLASLLAGTAPTEPPATARAQNPKASKTVKALRSWIKSYRAGRYDMGTPWELVTKKSVAKRAGLVPKGSFKAQKGDFNAFQELDLLCRLGAEENSALAAQVLLEISAVGLDRAYKYKPNMVPKMVSAIGQQYISKFNSIAARKYFVAAAEGNPVGSKKVKTALQAAACR